MLKWEILLKTFFCFQFRLFHSFVGRWSFAWSSCYMPKLSRRNFKEQCFTKLSSRKSCQRAAKRMSGIYNFLIDIVPFGWIHFLSSCSKYLIVLQPRISTIFSGSPWKKRMWGTYNKVQIFYNWVPVERTNAWSERTWNFLQPPKE